MAYPHSEIAGAEKLPSDALREKKGALLVVLARYGVVNPRIFGSVARGRDTRVSDVDLLVSKTTPMSYTTIARLRREASEALGCHVDLVFDTALKPEVEQEIREDLRPVL